MADLLFVAIVVAFFAVMVLLVKACDRIIGPDDAVARSDTADPEADLDVEAGVS